MNSVFDDYCYSLLSPIHGANIKDMLKKHEVELLSPIHGANYQKEFEITTTNLLSPIHGANQSPPEP